MLTLSNLLRATAQTHGHRAAIRDGEVQLSWDTWLGAIARTASVLRTLGLRPGERFGVLNRNCVLQGQLLYAGYWAGVVPVPLNFRLAPIEIALVPVDKVVTLSGFNLDAFVHFLAEHEERSDPVPSSTGSRIDIVATAAPWLLLAGLAISRIRL